VPSPLALLDFAGRLRRLVRLRLWAARTRLALRRRGCRLELVTGPGAGFRRAPTLEVQRDGAPAQRGPWRLTLHVGAHCDLGANLALEVVPGADSRIELGKGVRLGTGVRLVAAGGVLSVGAWSDVRDGVVLKAGGSLDVGDRTLLSYNSVVHCAEAVTIGDDATLAERVSVIDSDHDTGGSSRPVRARRLRTAAVSIGRNAWLGANTVVLRGVRIGDDAVVAAGSVVRAGDYPPRSLLAGVPAVARRSSVDPPDGGEG
jgi:acetyltransferase-like isoleucine patch superfamily enzyme